MGRAGDDQPGLRPGPCAPGLDPGRPPAGCRRASRHQQVLDLARPEAYAYILERLDALLREYRIDYLKWDHNRDLVDAGRAPSARPACTPDPAVYRLMDELRPRHPRLEIESCASGGARVDLGVLERTDRVWTSDCIDALERQRIQRWTGLLLPPELLGAHVGAPVAHTTGALHTLDFRAGTALFGHFGIEWDLTTADAAERARLAEWVALYRALRPLLHSGTVVRGDHPIRRCGCTAWWRRTAGGRCWRLVQRATGVHAGPAGCAAGAGSGRGHYLSAVAPESGGPDAYARPAWLTGKGCGCPAARWPASACRPRRSAPNSSRWSTCRRAEATPPVDGLNPPVDGLTGFLAADRVEHGRVALLRVGAGPQPYLGDRAVVDCRPPSSTQPSSVTVSPGRSGCARAGQDQPGDGGVVAGRARRQVHAEVRQVVDREGAGQQQRAVGLACGPTARRGRSRRRSRRRSPPGGPPG